MGNAELQQERSYGATDGAPAPAAPQDSGSQLVSTPLWAVLCSSPLKMSCQGALALIHQEFRNNFAPVDPTDGMGDVIPFWRWCQSELPTGMSH